MANAKPDFDAVVVGAGFAGMYMLYRLRERGLSVRVFETGTDVGGTWYWNRYPGARVDTETMFYSYQFSEELQQEWEWKERYPAQAELSAYARHVADRFELRPDIQFETRVDSTVWDEDAGLWRVETGDGASTMARYCIMATGCLSAVNTPEFDGLNDFAGETYHTAHWPDEGVDFTGKRVAVIGGVTKRFFPWAETPFSSDLRPDPNLRHSSPANDLINLVFVSNPLAPPKHNKELVQAVKAASGEYGLCLLPAPPVWLYQDISDLILAIENCIVAIDMETIKPTQISDLICTLEVASSQPSGWILYNAPLEWIRQKSIKKQARQLSRSACAVYS